MITGSKYILSNSLRKKHAFNLILSSLIVTINLADNDVLRTYIYIFPKYSSKLGFYFCPFKD